MLNIGLLHISSIACQSYIPTFSQIMFLLLVPSVLFLHEHNKFRVFEIRPLVVLHSLAGVYCVEEGGGMSPAWNGKKGEGDPYVEV